MKYRFLRGRASLGMARMTVRRHVWLPARIGLIVASLAVAVAAGVWIGRSDMPWPGVEQRRSELVRLRDENDALRTERDRLRDTPVATDSNAVMQRSTVEALGTQIARLEADNARLKEDVAFFEAATADRQTRAGAVGEVAIRRLQVVQDHAMHAARYRVLLTQDSRASQDFTGDVQLVVTLQRAGKAVNIAVPAVGPSAGLSEPLQIDGDPGQFRITFRSYKRIDGSFRLASDAVVTAVQVRIVSRGAVLAQQTVPVS